MRAPPLPRPLSREGRGESHHEQTPFSNQSTCHVPARRHQQGRVLLPGRPARPRPATRPRARCPAAARAGQPRPVWQADRRHGQCVFQHQQGGDPVAQHAAGARRGLPVWPGVHRPALRGLEWQLRQPLGGGGALRHPHGSDRCGAPSARRHLSRPHLAGQHRQDHRGACAHGPRAGAGDGRLRAGRRDFCSSRGGAGVHGPGGRWG